ncbi:MAG: tetratricopeptide repeat protein, partial [Solirubrobacteraceae bacterium]
LRVSPLVPIGLLAAVAGAVLALVLVGGGGGDTERQAASSTPRATQPARERTQARTTAQPAAGEQRAQTKPPPVAAASKEDPAALNDRGYALSQRGDYAGAIPLLRASVDGYRSAERTGELGYAFALFNLAVALNRSGDPGGAVALLRERLGFDNQRPTVRKELRAALAQLDENAGKGNRDE